jgi:hypothetical protein
MTGRQSVRRGGNQQGGRSRGRSRAPPARGTAPMKHQAINLKLTYKTQAVQVSAPANATFGDLKVSLKMAITSAHFSSYLCTILRHYKVASAVPLL